MMGYALDSYPHSSVNNLSPRLSISLPPLPPPSMKKYSYATVDDGTYTTSFLVAVVHVIRGGALTLKLRARFGSCTHLVESAPNH